MQILSQKNLRIPQSQIPAAFEQVKQRFGQHSRELVEAQTLTDCFAAWGFQTQAEEDGSLAVTGYSGDGTDAELFCTAIAPFVPAGGRLTLTGEGYTVRIAFTGEGCRVKWSRRGSE
jgi:hypothetical protein